MRSPAIITPGVDRVLAFGFGFFGNIMGVIAAALVIYVWASGGLPDEIPARRRHAARVAISAGLGCLAVFALVLVVMVLAAANHETLF